MKSMNRYSSPHEKVRAFAHWVESNGQIALTEARALMSGPSADDMALVMVFSAWLHSNVTDAPKPKRDKPQHTSFDWKWKQALKASKQASEESDEESSGNFN